MKKLAGFLVAFVLLQCGAAFAQTSDYEIIESYKTRHQSLLDSVRGAQDLTQCANLESEIGRLEADHTQHQKLLGEGLYPGNLDSSIGTLRDQLNKATERISMAEENRRDKASIETVSRKVEAAEKTIAEISSQNAEYLASIEKLGREVADLSVKIQQLSTENTGLLGQIKALQLESRKDKASIAKLQELTEKLNANIRDRDELIVKMMDSLFDEYSKSDLTDEQKKNLFANIQSNDYVGKIVATIDGNVRSVERTVMLPQDVGLINDEARKLSAKWNELKPFVGKLYPDEQTRAQDIGRVDGRLAEWKRLVDETTWKSIRQVFTGQNIDIGAFGNADEFQARLLAYIDEQTAHPSRARYQTFKNKVWDSPIKDQWLPVIPTDELTAKQRTDIDERVSLWGKKVSALVWRWVLIGAIGLAVIGVLVAVISRRKRPMPPVSQDITTQVR